MSYKPLDIVQVNCRSIEFQAKVQVIEIEGGVIHKCRVLEYFQWDKDHLPLNSDNTVDLLECELEGKD